MSAPSYSKNLTDKEIVLMDFVHGSHESIQPNIEKLFFPLYPTKIYRLFEKEHELKKEKVESKKYRGDVLVAEDNKTNQMLITILLDEYGVIYTLAEDGVQAYEKFQEKSFDLVLMDNNMPNMSGIEATEKILAYEEENSKSHTAIIALTANASNADRERFLASGMDDFLSKPIDVKELERIFDKYLDPKEKLFLKIDYEVLSERLGLPVKMIDKLVESFMIETSKTIERLQEAIEVGQMNDIELYAHAIRGSADNLSLDEMACEAKMVEDTAKEHNSHYDYQASLNTINSLFSSLKKG